MTLQPPQPIDVGGRGHAPDQTPASLGLSMPAEWSDHEATWLAWPHQRNDWPGKINAVQWAYGEMIRKITAGELVRLLVNDDASAGRAATVLKRAGVDLGRVEMIEIPTNRAWTRDHGAIFLRGPGGRLAVARFGFNAWARFRGYLHDRCVAERIAGHLGLADFTPIVAGRQVILEGGAIEVDGEGTVLVTEECLLDQRVQARNPGLSRDQIERVLREFLGVTNVIWLARGIAGDDTHGHIDDVCRFVRPGLVVLCREDNPADPNHDATHENRDRLESARLADGGPIEVVELPLPEPLLFNGVRMAASYANFYVTNRFVLVPTFNDPADRVALGMLAELFPGRTVAGIHAVDLILGGGTIHCLTQQQPTGQD